MIVRAKSPLRLGLAGGGTDVSPYCDTYGGCVLNAAIDMYAYCTIERCDNGFVEFNASDLGKSFKKELDGKPIALSDELILHKAVYNRIVNQFNGGQDLSIVVTTYSDAPPGSGLGSSSTMVVSMLSAYQQLLNLPFGEYDLAHLAFEIERKDCGLSGGKQDQYATTFGGINFIEFSAEDRVLVNPLRIKTSIINELESHILLFYTGVSRDSSKIIDDQISSTASNQEKRLDAMHELKEISYQMKECLLRSDIEGIGKILKKSWEAKVKTSSKISNDHINAICSDAINNGADAVKVSGAGGGGFIMVFVRPQLRYQVIKSLSVHNGTFYRFKFTNQGTESWVA